MYACNLDELHCSTLLFYGIYIKKLKKKYNSILLKISLEVILLHTQLLFDMSLGFINSKTNLQKASQKIYKLPL